MYELFNRISNFLSEPFFFASQTDIAVLAALFLGLVGSLAPCQLSTNSAAILYFGKRQIQALLSWKEVLFYVIGKILVYSILGLLFWALGQEFSSVLTPIFAMSRKFLGPLLILMGVIMLGMIKIPLSIGSSMSKWLDQKARSHPPEVSAFFLGVAFSIGFCPTMLLLFGGYLMPLALSNSAGFFLPPIFAIGTAMPFLVLAGLVFAFGIDKKMVIRSKRWGTVLRNGIAILFLILGISDAITYWSISS